MFCKHNYVYTQGHFYCTKCHHRTHKERFGKRKGSKKAIGLTVVIVGIIGFMFVSGIFNFNQGNLEESIKNIPTNIEESIQGIQESLPEIPSEIPSVIPSKSSLIGYSHTLDKVVFTVLDVTYSESNNPKYSKFMIITMKADNQDSKSKTFNPKNFYLLDQHLIRYDGKITITTLKPSIPEDFTLRFEIPKDDSLSFSLHIPVSAVTFSRDSVNIGVI